MKISTIFWFLIIINLSSASRILFLFPTPSKSHVVVAHGLSSALAERGHDVTVFSPFPLNKQIKNHREFQTPFKAEHKEIMDNFAKGKDSFPMLLMKFPKLSVDLAQLMINSTDFQNILNEKFDLIFIGITFHNFLLGYGDHFNCPTAMFSVQKHTSYSNILVANPYEINAVNYGFASTGDLTKFTTRLFNFIMYIIEEFHIAYIEYYDRIAYKNFFPSSRYRSYEESITNVSLVLVNDHFSERNVRPNVPAVVEIRGIQIKPKPDELPKDIQEFLDDATEGAILFCLGSNVQAEHLPNNKINILLRVFGKLKQKVIMKWDSEIKEKPDNVMLKKWLPQDDILAHENMKLFISHCGLGSVVESKYHGVPIIGMPLFAEQQRNCHDIGNEGWSLQLNLKAITENELSEAIKEMLQNKSYSNKVKKLSQLNRDRPMSARETAIYWIEYVIRHHGAPHMQYLAVHQNFWQKTSLDVVAFLSFCFIIIFKFVALLFKVYLKNLKRGSLNVKKKNM